MLKGQWMKFLIDTSVLIAWLWRSHRFNHYAEAWAKDKSGRIYVCPMSEIMFLRVATSQDFGATLEDAREVLRLWWKKHQPQMLPADLRTLDASVSPSSKKVFDWYFADLAAKHGMKWATLDDRIAHPAAEPIYPKRPTPSTPPQSSD
jgi:predicted nucleic acid-binding protein